MSEKYKEDKRLHRYWKEVNDERKRGVNGNNEGKEVVVIVVLLPDDCGSATSIPTRKFGP